VVRAVAKRPELQALLGRDYVSILAQTCRSCSPRQSCGTGCQTFLLDADGTVYPCLNLSCPEMAAGNVLVEPFRKIWSLSMVSKQVREQTTLAGRPRTCGKCFARHFCMGGCRGETYANTGRLDAPSVTCAQGRAAIVQTMWTLADNPWLVGRRAAHC
jgi:radical SAM protein with 4Fe4S-binding SPASM domain